MTLTQVKNVNFGPTRSGFIVTYSVLDDAGSVVQAPTATGVYESVPGIYAAKVTFFDGFHGQILWHCPASGSLASLDAAEQYNVEENDPKVSLTHSIVTQMSGTLGQLYDMQFGRWHIVNNQMIFYKEDGVTEVGRYNLYDSFGVPTMDAVFDRQKV